MYERGLQLRRFLELYFKTRSLNNDSKEKCVIVSHSAFLTSLSVKGFDKVKHDLVEPENMHDCQFIPWLPQLNSSHKLQTLPAIFQQQSFIR
jgi:hypothetical protein